MRLAPVLALTLATPGINKGVRHQINLPAEVNLVPDPQVNLAPALLLPSPLPASLAPLSAAPLAAASADAPEPLEPAAALRSLNAFWDGVPALDAFQALEPLAGDAGERPAPWLSVSDPEAQAAVDRAVRLAKRTRVGRAALRDAEAALAGASLAVDVLDLQRNHGEFDYLAGRLRLHEKLTLPGQEATLAGTLVHELRHVAQHALGIPSNAREMEIEAHLDDLALLQELGLEPPPKTFARQLADALAKGEDAFLELLEAAVPGTVLLGEGGFDEVRESLKDDLKRAKKRAKKGSEEDAALASVIERDLARLETAEGRAAYSSFAKRVRRRLKSLARPPNEP